MNNNNTTPFYDNIPTQLVDWSHKALDTKMAPTARANYIDNISKVRDYCEMVLSAAKPNHKKTGRWR